MRGAPVSALITVMLQYRLGAHVNTTYTAVPTVKIIGAKRRSKSHKTAKASAKNKTCAGRARHRFLPIWPFTEVKQARERAQRTRRPTSTLQKFNSKKCRTLLLQKRGKTENNTTRPFLPSFLPSSFPRTSPKMPSRWSADREGHHYQRGRQHVASSPGGEDHRSQGTGKRRLQRHRVMGLKNWDGFDTPFSNFHSPTAASSRSGRFSWPVFSFVETKMLMSGGVVCFVVFAMSVVGLFGCSTESAIYQRCPVLMSGGRCAGNDRKAVARPMKSN